MRKNWRSGICWLILAWVSLSNSACTFNRTVVNGNYRDFDLSFIEPGKTTYLEVLTTLGPPSDSRAPEEAISAVFSRRALLYTTYEEKRVGCLLQYFVTLNFDWTDTQKAYQLMLEFDDNDRVTNGYLSRRKAIWRPFTSEKRRPPATLEVLFEDGEAR